MIRRSHLLAGVSILAVALTVAGRAAELERVEFVGMDAPKTAAEMSRMYTTAQVRYVYADGSERLVPLAYDTLYTNLDRVGTNPYEAGRLYDANGMGLVDPYGRPVIAETPDGTTLHLVPGAPTGPNGDALAYHIVHWEYDWLLSNGANARKTKGWYPRMPMAMNVNTIAQDRGSGRLTAIEQRNVDFASVGGLWIPCNASLTPWNTHLAGEEDYDLFNRRKVDKSVRGLTEVYFGNARNANPYNYGYPVEVAVGPDGRTAPTKHYSMGRGSWEVATVMPDGRTAYYGDDGRYTGLFMYVADRAGSLSAGTLYAAKWEQQSAENGGTAKLVWIRLGHAADWEVAEMMKEERFSSTESTIFEFFDPPGVPKLAEDADEAAKAAHAAAVEAREKAIAAALADGFKAIQAGTKKPEYVRLRPGKEKAAAFLETRRYAAWLGASTEFNKMEGVAVDPEGRTVFIAMSRIEGGMVENDGGPQDDVRLPKNGAGGVYALRAGGGVTDSEGNPIDSEWVAAVMEGVPQLMGRDLAEPDALGNRSDPDLIAEPDNLAFSRATRTLFIGEDSGRHTNNFLWAFNVDTGALVRLASGPAGAELTGLSIVENWNGHAYITTNYQHPTEGLAKRKMDEDLKAELLARIDPFVAGVGYFGPLPALSDGTTRMASSE